MYASVDGKINFALQEEIILKFWQEQDIFVKSLKQREGCQEYVQYDGPPFATGLPHYGHLIQSAIKDTLPRYHTMKGRHVERRFGWDCHGLPVEYEVEKMLGISGKSAIEAYGVDKFNEQCRSIVLRYTQAWQEYINRIGRWVDFENDYKTMDISFMESIWQVFKQLWDKQLIEEGYYILPYCPRCSTVLSNHELNLGGYKDVNDQSASVRFIVNEQPSTSFIAWTTTPWTLPSNLALAVGPEIEYVKVRETDGQHFILAKSRLSHYFAHLGDEALVWQGTGKELAGLTYQPVFSHYAHLRDQGAFVVVCGDYVTDSDGTGVVHTAPGFGEDDYQVLRGTGIPVVTPIDAECRFTADIPEYAGRFVKDCDKDILTYLKEQGLLVKKENYLHSYPHCYRCSSPLIYRAITSWFVNVPKIRDRMLAANEQITWIPGHLQQGRFGKWLENARDWAISRNRFWGNPIPVWRCSCGNTMTVGSLDELEQLSGQRPSDLHKHFVDQITLPCSCGQTMHRIPEVFDCWFESGSMPYAQNHYPFENKEKFEQSFPADFIAEGIDQTRGWFYTLTILSAALFDKPAFKMCLTTGLVLASDGRKMSKSLRNFTDPLEIVRTYGADATRLYLQSSALTRGEDLRFSDEGVKDVLKNVLLPLWNAYSFFVTYARIDHFTSQGLPEMVTHPLDQWILAMMHRTIADVDGAMQQGDLQKAIAQLLQFLDYLNNWYIRRSRRRFWKSENDNDKWQAYETLYHVLITFCHIAAPFMPFITETIYQNLRRTSDPISIHLCDWPTADVNRRNSDLEEKMALVMQAVKMGHALRSSFNLKNRLPLNTVYVVSRNEHERAILQEMQNILLEELNVKKVAIQSDEQQLVEYKAKANFKVLGKILGGDMKVVAQAVEQLSPLQIAGLLDGATITINFDGKEHQQLEIMQEHILVQRIEKAHLKALNEDTLTVALDTHITPELEDEGLMRDLIRLIQNLRKERDLEVSDHIVLLLDGDETMLRIIDQHRHIICEETLAHRIEIEQGPHAISTDCDGHALWLDLVKD